MLRHYREDAAVEKAAVHLGLKSKTGYTVGDYECY